MASSEDFKRIMELYKPLAEMKRQDFVNTKTELKTMISSLKLTIDTLRQTINSQNATIALLQKLMDRLQSAYDNIIKDRDDLNNRLNRSKKMKYHTLIETCKNVGLNMKEYFTYVFSRLLEGEKYYEKLLPSAVAR